MISHSLSSKKNILKHYLVKALGEEVNFEICVSEEWLIYFPGISEERLVSIAATLRYCTTYGDPLSVGAYICKEKNSTYCFYKPPINAGRFKCTRDTSSFSFHESNIKDILQSFAHVFSECNSQCPAHTTYRDNSSLNKEKKFSLGH